ncbi:putative mitochondrial protein [Cardamine amara subsp. amara]|uniref:Mitochondrial protein n=1 Tax=Cardamine amara subsp. amara TaxID=228776 RepID=A0ABD1C1P6_CARAN
MECVSSVTYTFLIIGAPKRMVTTTRGLRQGDPLSSYLFIICTEVLSSLCEKAKRNGKLKEVKVAKKSPFINHILFADDTIFFCRMDEESYKELLSILNR